MSSDHTNGETMETEQKKTDTDKTGEEKMDTSEETKQKGSDQLKKEEDEDEEEEESSDEEELPLGSVEAPVQIMTGKRDRKKVERLVMADTPKTPEKKFEIPVGKGTKLGDMPMICYYLDKFKVQDLKPLHKFLFGKTVRDIRETKKNIKLFTGFNFEKDDPEYAKREALLCKFTVEGMKELCTILDVEKKGTKDKMMERLMDFCMNPQPSDRKPPEKGQRGRKKGSTKKTKPKKSKGSAKKKTKAGGDASTVSEDGDTTIEDETEGEKDEEEKDSSAADEESKPAKTKAKSTPKPKKEKSAKNKDTPKSKTKSPKKKMSVKTSKAETKKASPVKSKKTPQKRKLENMEDDDSSDDEPLVKKTKQPPTDKEIRKTIERILEGANLEEVTMKMVCREVYDAYPEFPLQHKKDYIKATVREIIS